MDNNKELKKAQFLKEFVLKVKDFYEKTKNCKHYYNEDFPNPYHMENDLWTHTMLVYKSLELFNTDDDTDNDVLNKSLMVAALTHD